MIARKRRGAIGAWRKRALLPPDRDWSRRKKSGSGPELPPHLRDSCLDAIGRPVGSFQDPPLVFSLSPFFSTRWSTFSHHHKAVPHTRHLGCPFFLSPCRTYFSFHLFDFETVWPGLWPRLCASFRTAFLFPCVHHHYPGRHYFRVYALDSRCPGNATVVIFTVITSYIPSKRGPSYPSSDFRRVDILFRSIGTRPLPPLALCIWNV